MLLVDPVKVLRQFLVPAVIGIVGVRSSSGDWPLWMLPVAVVGAVVIGVAALADDPFPDHRDAVPAALRPAQQEAADGARSTGSAASTSSLRCCTGLLGLAKVEIGTGVDDTRISLDSLAAPQSQDLRRVLLARRSAALAATPPSTAGRPAAYAARRHPSRPTQPETVLVASTGPGSATRRSACLGWPSSPGAIGVLSQFGDSLPFLDEDSLESGWNWVLGFAIPLVVLVALVAGAIAWTLISVAGYAVQWWDFVLREPRDPAARQPAPDRRSLHHPLDHAWRRPGSAASSSTSRCCCAWSAAASSRRWRPASASSGVTKVLPPCPVEVATGVGSALLEDDTPSAARSSAHGPAARRRCHVRDQWGTLFFTAAAITATAVLDLGWWLPVVVVRGLRRHSAC